MSDIITVFYVFVSLMLPSGVQQISITEVPTFHECEKEAEIEKRDNPSAQVVCYSVTAPRERIRLGV